MSSRAATKAALREERIALQHAEERAAARRRRLRYLAGISAVAAVAIAVLIMLSASGSDEPAAPSATPAAASSLFAGIPQQGLAVGRPKAPVTLVEYADLQCPACRMYAEQVFPTLMSDYVRSGRLRLEIRLQSFLGPDSVTAAAAVAAASLQDRAWPLIDLLYRNQGAENSGYVTDDFLTRLGGAVPGLDVDRMNTQRRSAAASRIVDGGSAEFAALGLTGTPSFQIGRTGGELQPLEVSSFDPAEFTAAVDAQLAQ